MLFGWEWALWEAGATEPDLLAHTALPPEAPAALSQPSSHTRPSFLDSLNVLPHFSCLQQAPSSVIFWQIRI